MAVSNRSFFKVLITPDFDSRLRLPPQFVTNNRETLPVKATLRIESGESWIVRIERMGQNSFFTGGWEQFSKDVALELRQFLLFKFDGRSVFTVSVYGISGCQEELTVCGTSQGTKHNGPIVVAEKSESEDEDVKIEEEEGLHGGEIPPFQTELKRHNECEVEVPPDFARAAGITQNRKIFLRMQLKSKKWPVCVVVRKNVCLVMTVGWNDFLVGTKLSIGSTISFELLSSRRDILVEVKLVKSGKKGLYSPKKRAGRPPKLT